MTIEEMQYRFNMIVKERGENQEFGSYDVQKYLNESQTLIVVGLADNFETDEKARAWLYPILKNVSITLSKLNSEGFHTNGFNFSLPSDFFYTVKEQISVDSSSKVKVKPQRYDYYNTNINNPFKKPYYNSNNDGLFWRLDAGINSSGLKIHEIITDGTIPATYHISYITKPTDVDIVNGIDCQLHSNIHFEIVRKAVELALTDRRNAAVGTVSKDDNNK